MQEDKSCEHCKWCKVVNEQTKFKDADGRVIWCNIGLHCAKSNWLTNTNGEMKTRLVHLRHADFKIVNAEDRTYKIIQPEARQVFREAEGCMYYYDMREDRP